MVLKKRVWIAVEVGELSRRKSLPEACSMLDHYVDPLE
jgi:hypothetical protein